MTGIPAVLATRQDWLNAYQYAQANPTTELKKSLRDRLIAMKATRYMKVLKAGVVAGPEEQTQDDFEDALDPASPFAQSGLLENEIDQMTGALSA
jgi:hypothetical protein